VLHRRTMMISVHCGVDGRWLRHK